MARVYTKKEIRTELKKAIDKGASVYNLPMVNYGGVTSDTKNPYTEVISEFLLEHGIVSKDKISKIQSICRNESYRSESHKKLLNPCNNESYRKEENFVKSLFLYNPFEKILGKALDYQIPLKDHQTDNAGKIDLITHKENKLFLVEVKKLESKETLLRAITEIQTYYQICDTEKLLKDFGKEGCEIEKAILIFEGSRPANEYDEIEKRTYLKKVIDLLGVKIFVVKLRCTDLTDRIKGTSKNHIFSFRREKGAGEGYT